MNRKSRLIAGGVVLALALALALVLLLSSDDEKKAVTSTPGSTLSEAEKKHQEAHQVIDLACALLTPDDVSEVIGRPVQAGDRGLQLSETLSGCKFDDEATLNVSILGEVAAQKTFDEAKAAATDAEDVADVGEKAIFEARTKSVSALSGKYIVSIQIKQGDDPAVAKTNAIALTKRAIDRIPSDGHVDHDH